MLPIEGQPILTAAQMRAAEERAAPTPEAMYALMERAGAGAADVVRRLAAGAEVLILCGPGNNGGDGYVAARVLREAGVPVRLAALTEPATDLARRARQGWIGPVETLLELINGAGSGPIILDCLFGTGARLPLPDDLLELLVKLSVSVREWIAVDLPSGVDADAMVPPTSLTTSATLTLALGALKPAHVLEPAASLCGEIRVLDLGLNLCARPGRRNDFSLDCAARAPSLREPRADHHKYSRGMVVVIGGAMPGAAALAVEAAMRAGAGYGLLLGERVAGLPHAVVQRPWSADALASALAGKPNCVVVIGPGLGRSAEAVDQLETALGCDCPLIIDGDALHLLEGRHLDAISTRGDDGPYRVRTVLTPHGGEFKTLFGDLAGSKIEQARTAASRSGVTVAFKGRDTVVAQPNGFTTVASGGGTWLSTAGTGDVLAGAIAGVWQAATDPVEAGVWLHAEAARLCGASFIADDLAAALTPARASLCR